MIYAVHLTSHDLSMNRFGDSHTEIKRVLNYVCKHKALLDFLAEEGNRKSTDVNEKQIKLKEFLANGIKPSSPDTEGFSLHLAVNSICFSKEQSRALRNVVFVCQEEYDARKKKKEEEKQVVIDPLQDSKQPALYDDLLPKRSITFFPQVRQHYIHELRGRETVAIPSDIASDSVKGNVALPDNKHSGFISGARHI